MLICQHLIHTLFNYFQCEDCLAFYFSKLHVDMIQNLHCVFYCSYMYLIGHVERMDDYRMARRVLMAEVSEGRVRGRPILGWMDGVKVALGNRGMTVEAARQCAKDRKAWRALVHM